MRRPDTPRPATPLEPLLSIVETAEILNVSRRSLERLIAAGQFPKPDLRIGRMPRWHRKTLREFTERN